MFQNNILGSIYLSPTLFPRLLMLRLIMTLLACLMIHFNTTVMDLIHPHTFLQLIDIDVLITKIIVSHPFSIAISEEISKINMHRV